VPFGEGIMNGDRSPNLWAPACPVQPPLSEPMSNDRYRNWVFTLNNPPIPYGELQCEGASYMLYQLERAPATGTLHYQGLVVMPNKARLQGLKKKIPGAHFEPMRGTLEQAIAYCEKPETKVDGPWSFGERPKGPGARSDLMSLKEAIDQGKTEVQIAQEQFPAWSRSYKAVERYRRLVTPHR